MQELLLSPIPKKELIEELLSGFESILKDQQNEHLSSKEWLSTREVSDMLKISTVTCHQWAKRGILKKHRIGSRVRYRKDEVLSALKEVESRKRH